MSVFVSKRPESPRRQRMTMYANLDRQASPFFIFIADCRLVTFCRLARDRQVNFRLPIPSGKKEPAVFTAGSRDFNGRQGGAYLMITSLPTWVPNSDSI